MTSPDLKAAEIHYPESDGQPMGESDLHRDLMIELILTARDFFRQLSRKRDGAERAGVYVSGSLVIYYEQGNPEAVVSPDFFVVPGIGTHRRKSYKLWEEGKAPALAIEVTSPKSHITDIGDKRAIYERLGVLEYYVFDPEGLRFDPPFRGFELQAGNLVPVEPAHKPDGTLVFQSAVLGLELHALGESLHFVDAEMGHPVPLPDELREQLRAEAARTREAEGRAEAAEAELVRLRRELGRDDPSPPGA